MITKEELEKLLLDIENSRVERTISITDTDKFGQAICAFCNDFPDSQQSGYLIIGAFDNGARCGLRVTDQLQLNIAAIRSDGNIQPQPAMTIEKFSFPDGELLVAEVQPSNFPPVRYKSKIWIRVGARKGVANEAEEKILYEKRAANIKTFDAMPCTGANLDDLDIKLFKTDYLPKAFPEDILSEDKRDIKLKLQSLGFYDLRFDCPTYAGIVLFGINPEKFLAGCYVQYVRFAGEDRAGEIMNEHKFDGNLVRALHKMDTFVELSIAKEKPVPVSALREMKVISYPYYATRELLMNAVMHRDYESNAPTRFYEFDSYIEIQNAGGLYGKARPENFPDVNDYRNPVIAETMKVLGYVNRYNRGIVRVQKELAENGNGKAFFDLTLITAFKVVEPISGRVNTKLVELTVKQLSVLKFCSTAKSSGEIFTFIGITKQTKNFRNHIQPLIDTDFLTYTKTGKTDVKGQQYIITTFGKEWLKVHEE
ncbi:MAG: RNA-binding domain-containing protein [Bacteroidota bacterium]